MRDDVRNKDSMQTMSSPGAPLLTLRGVRKTFGAVEALRHADLTVAEGQVVALLGDNGAGKSTLVRVLSGVWRRDGGEMRFAGKFVDAASYSVRAARRLGIETVHQDRALCEGQALWRNLFVGRHLRNAFGFIDVRREREIARHILGEWIGLTGAGIDPDAPVRVLSGGERQALAIGRAMYFGARLVILDEPTTGLSLKEVNRVMAFIERLRSEGRSVLLVSHHVQQACDVADRFVLMDRGRTVADLERNGVTPDSLARRLLELAEGAHVREGASHAQA